MEKTKRRRRTARTRLAAAVETREGKRAILVSLLFERSPGRRKCTKEKRRRLMQRADEREASLRCSGIDLLLCPVPRSRQRCFAKEKEREKEKKRHKDGSEPSHPEEGLKKRTSSRRNSQQVHSSCDLFPLHPSAVLQHPTRAFASRCTYACQCE